MFNTKITWDTNYFLHYDATCPQLCPTKAHFSSPSFPTLVKWSLSLLYLSLLLILKFFYFTHTVGFTESLYLLTFPLESLSSFSIVPQHLRSLRHLCLTDEHNWTHTESHTHNALLPLLSSPFLSLRSTGTPVVWLVFSQLFSLDPTCVWYIMVGIRLFHKHSRSPPPRHILEYSTPLPLNRVVATWLALDNEMQMSVMCYFWLISLPIIVIVKALKQISH